MGGGGVMPRDQRYIDGQWVHAAAGATRAVINPHDASELTRVADGDREDAAAAIQAARRAFDQGDWPRRPAAEIGRAHV